jgi:glycosyltransferase involved in cell wall biosynthesis
VKSRVSHVAQISFFIDPQGRRPDQLLQEWPSLVDVAEATLDGGSRVTVIQACATRGHISRNGVEYYFVPSGLVHPDGTASISRGEALRDLVPTLAPDVLHVHGLGFPGDVAELADLVPNVPILLQDHADRLPRFWRRHSWRRGFNAAAGFAFCAREQAEPFAHAGLIRATSTIFEIPECTARFTPGDRVAARRRTGLSGSPCLLWVGHLDRNKDPLTVLQGVSQAARQMPGLRLWCCFGEAPQLADVRQKIEQDESLRGKVTLLGRVDHERVEQLMRAADLFILGSHREGSGYALIEALACGLPPVVTDIPSFRALTGRGAIGWLWPSGDADAVCDVLLAAASRPLADYRPRVRAHFEQELSFAAVGRKLNAAYARLLGRDATTAASIDVASTDENAA